MSNLDDVLIGGFIEQEQQETKSKQIEERIKSFDRAEALLTKGDMGNQSINKVWFNSWINY